MRPLTKMSLLALTLAATSAFANPVVPTFTTFGPTTDTFGGTGIPNNAVATTTVDGVTLALTATAKGASNPTVTNNGAGIFSAVSGAYSAGSPHQARWNFDYAVDGTSTVPLTYDLLVDINPAVGNDLSTYVNIGDPTTISGLGATNSENLGFSFISGGTFDPTAPGEYGIVLEALNANGTIAGETAILVDVPAGVPEPAGIALVGIALLAMSATRRRKVKI